MGHISKPFGTDTDDEHDADKFARDILIDEVAFNAFAKNGYLTRATISQFAARMGISPGIVVGRLQKENFIPYNQFNDLKVRYEITAWCARYRVQRTCSVQIYVHITGPFSYIDIAFRNSRLYL